MIEPEQTELTLGFIPLTDSVPSVPWVVGQKYD